MNSVFSPAIEKTLKSFDELISKGESGVMFPRTFCQQFIEEAWNAAMRNRSSMKQLADKLMEIRPEINISNKAAKRLPPEGVLTVVYGSPNYRQSLIDKLGKDAAAPFYLEAQLPRLLREIISIDTLEKLNAAASLSIHQALGLFESHFEKAIPLVCLGLPNRFYPAVLALPYLVSQYANASGRRLYVITLAIHIILADMPIRGLAELALSAWPCLREEFSYSLLISRYHQKDSSGRSWLYGAAINALQSNLHEIANELSGDGASAPFRAMNKLLEINQKSPLNYHQLAAERLASIYFPFLIPGQKRLVELAEMMGSPDDLPPVQPWRLPELDIPVSITGDLMKLCLEFDNLQVPDSCQEKWLGLERQMTHQHQTLTQQRKMVHQLSAEGASINISELANTAERLAKLADQMKANWMSMHDILNDIARAHDAFVARWQACCHPTPSTPKAAGRTTGDGDSDALELALLEVKEFRESNEAFKQENHRLRSKLDALTNPGVTPGGVVCPEIPLELTRKIVRDASKCTPREVLEYIQALAGDKLVVLPSAWESADNSARFEYSSRLVFLLDTLVFDYAATIANGTPDSEARKVFGGAYSACESETTRNADEFRRLRTFLYKGEPHYFERHLKIGNCPGPARGMRIYFEIIEGVVVIAYCGQHLSVINSN